MIRVLVTGATGFVGRPLVQKLTELGAEVHAVSRTVVGLPGEVRHHPVDLLAPGAASELAARVKASHLLHLAWDATPGRYWTSTDNLRWVEATLALVRSFLEQGGRRIVGAGTCAEYDWRQGRCTEDVTALEPNTLYGRCKLATGAILRSFAEVNRISAAWGRIFFIYGPGEKRERLIPSVVTSLMRGEPAVCSVGTQARDFVYLDDAVQAFVRLLEGEFQGPVNIASGKATTIREVAGEIGRQLGRPELLRFERPLPANEPPLLVADVQRLTSTGWTPHVSLAEGLGRSIAWWRDQESDTQRR